jgi:undecaprenyl-diphosphatase
MLLYGLLAAYLIHRASSWPARVGIACAALAMVVLVAFSRVYLGAHYLSDVLAAAAEGAAWLTVCLTSVTTLRRHRAARQSTN